MFRPCTVDSSSSLDAHQRPEVRKVSSDLVEIKFDVTATYPIYPHDEPSNIPCLRGLQKSVGRGCQSLLCLHLDPLRSFCPVLCGVIHKAEEDEEGIDRTGRGEDPFVGTLRLWDSIVPGGVQPSALLHVNTNSLNETTKARFELAKLIKNDKMREV